MYNKVKDALIGLAIGDALGVPVEFKSREWFQKQPLIDMIGYGTHHQPPGTWSDDSSLTFCTVQSLMKGLIWMTLRVNLPDGTEMDIGQPMEKYLI